MRQPKHLWGALAALALGAHAVAAEETSPGLSAFAPAGTLALGVNYWESRSATQMWRKWSPETVEKDCKTDERNATEEK